MEKKLFIIYIGIGLTFMNLPNDEIHTPALVIKVIVCDCSGTLGKL